MGDQCLSNERVTVITVVAHIYNFQSISQWLYYTMSSGHAKRIYALSLRGMRTIRYGNYSPYGRMRIGAGIISVDIIPIHRKFLSR